MLNMAKESGRFVNIGQRTDAPYQQLEDRCGALYGLFAKDIAEPANAEDHRRVHYIRSES